MTPGGPSPEAGWEAALQGGRPSPGCTQAWQVQASWAEMTAGQAAAGRPPPASCCRLHPTPSPASRALTFLSFQRQQWQRQRLPRRRRLRFPRAGWGQPGVRAPQWPGWACWSLRRRVAPRGRKGSPGPPFIEHLLHARQSLHGAHTVSPETHFADGETEAQGS